MKMSERFIKVTCVLNNPTHEKSETWVDSKSIIAFGASPTEFTNIGAATAIWQFNGSMTYIEESCDELLEKLSFISDEK